MLNLFLGNSIEANNMHMSEKIVDFLFINQKLGTRKRELTAKINAFKISKIEKESEEKFARIILSHSVDFKKQTKNLERYKISIANLNHELLNAVEEANLLESDGMRN
jgi:hypothetical protein